MCVSESGSMNKAMLAGCGCLLEVSQGVLWQTCPPRLHVSGCDVHTTHTCTHIQHAHTTHTHLTYNICTCTHMHTARPHHTLTTSHTTYARAHTCTQRTQPHTHSPPRGVIESPPQCTAAFLTPFSVFLTSAPLLFCQTDLEARKKQMWKEQLRFQPFELRKQWKRW